MKSDGFTKVFKDVDILQHFWISGGVFDGSGTDNARKRADFTVL
jgi:hypothetical protein